MVMNNFWIWFRKSLTYIEAEIRAGHFVYDLDKQITQLGDFGWEVGELENEPNLFYLVISGGGTELDMEAKEIILNAPQIPNWKFYFWKQRRKAKDFYRVFNHQFNEFIEIDITNWKFVLYEFDDGTYDIEVLVPSSFLLFSEQFQQEVAEIVLNSVVGEEFRIKFILEIDFVLDSNTRAIPFKKLWEIFGNG